MSASTRDASAVSALGTLADGVVGSGTRDGLVRFDAAGIEIDWWIGSDDGWKIPARAGVHTIRPGVAPAIESRLRVPGGDVVLGAAAVAGSSSPVVVLDLENASPAAAVVVWVVRAAPGYRIGRVAIDGSTLLIDERARIELPRVPLRWAVETRAVGVHHAIVEGRAASGHFEPVTTRRGDLEVALLFPVAHRTRTRIAASIAGAQPVSVAPLPALADVERGWTSALERGMQVELPDHDMQAAVDSARSMVLIGAVGATRRDRAIASAAAEWGLSDAPLPRVRGPNANDPWPSLGVPRGGATVGPWGSTPREAAAWLAAVRDALVHVERDRIDLLPYYPVDWLGLPVAVHAVPTRFGPVSFALRWHGARPALLWEVPPGVRVRAPGLDPSWEGVAAAGEALLAEIDATHLLPLRTATSRDPGVTIDEPGSFT